VGKAVIASDFPVHVEQAAPGSSFFHMGDADDCARAIAFFLQAKAECLPFSRAQHDARVLDFARTFMGIVNAALSRPSPATPENQIQPQEIPS